MALFKTRSAAVYGIDAHLIDVEVDMYKSGTARDFITVGMPDVAVRESRERIKSALINSGFGFPISRHHQSRSGRGRRAQCFDDRAPEIGQDDAGNCFSDVLDYRGTCKRL
jgi:hypothetical protein